MEQSEYDTLTVHQVRSMLGSGDLDQDEARQLEQQREGGVRRSLLEYLGGQEGTEAKESQREEKKVAQRAETKAAPGDGEAPPGAATQNVKAEEGNATLTAGNVGHGPRRYQAPPRGATREQHVGQRNEQLKVRQDPDFANFVIVEEDVFDRVVPVNAQRPTFRLLFRRGQKVPWQLFERYRSRYKTQVRDE